MPPEAGTEGVTSTPPVETQAAGQPAPAAQDDTQPQAGQPNETTASEGVKPQDQQEDKHVPYDRFKEVNDRAKSEAKKREELEAKLAEFEAGKAEKTEDEPQIDPEAQKVLDSYLKSKGFVTQEELQAKEMQLQADADVKELQREFKDFDREKVLEFAQENGLLINNKAGLKAAYNLMKSSDPAAKDAMRNALIAELKESGQLAGQFGEKPGPGGARLTPGERPQGTRNILRAAIQKHRAG